ELGADAVGDVTGAQHAADVGGNDHHLGGVVVFRDVAGEDWRGGEVVGGDGKKALDLGGVQIEGQDAVGAGVGDEIGHQLGRYGRAGGRFPVLAGIAVIGQHGGDAAGRGSAHGVDQDQQLHQMVV